MDGVKKLFGKKYKIKLIKKNNGSIENYIDSSTAVVMLSHINYKTGKINDIKKITDIAHKKGALIIWDISHSVGVMPLHLHNHKVDFAVGSTYKHLNGGPGSPGFLYINNSHIKKSHQPLTGWMGHVDPFKFSLKYYPADDINKYICGTPSIISYKALESALNIFKNVSMNQIRKKSLKLGEIFIDLMNQECSDFGFKLISPTINKERGSQISFSHKNAYQIIQALISYGVIGDFRHPNILRFGLSPLYMRYEDLIDAINCLKKIMVSEEWKSQKYNKKYYVT